MACWNLNAQIDIAGEHLTINQKIVHDKVYSFASGHYLIDIKMPKAENIIWTVTEKNGLTLKKLFSKAIGVILNSQTKSEQFKMSNNEFAQISFQVKEI